MSNSPSDKPVRHFRITSSYNAIDGIEFEVPGDATEEDIRNEAFEAIVGHINYGYEEIE